MECDGSSLFNLIGTPNGITNTLNRQPCFRMYKNEYINNTIKVINGYGNDIYFNITNGYYTFLNKFNRI